MLTLSDAGFFATANYIESALWGLIALVFAVAATRRAGQVRLRCTLASVSFLLFGLSDVVEVATGAWWRPWWLLVWKGACVSSLLGLLVSHVRDKRQ